MESYVSFSIISVFFYTFMILTLLAGKRSRIINSFMCVLGGMLCWTLGSFLMRMEQDLLHPVVLCVSGRNPVSAIFLLCVHQ